jgi:Tfp pilus assembly protein PilV
VTRAAAARARARLAAERGSMLIEVMIGAIVLAITAGAVMNGLDGAQSTGAKNRNRSIQATLAQQDIERMRAIPVTALSNLRQTRTVTMQGVDYTVVSRTDWVRDASGVVTCSDDQTQAEYLKLSSTVTSPATTKTPVTQAGLLTPAVGQLDNTRGTATVKLTDRDGNPLVGVRVTLSGPSSQSDTTNSLGCAVFGYIPSGTYTVQVAGYVEPASVSPASEPLVVYASKASFGQLQVDRPATLRASFRPPAGQTLPVVTGGPANPTTVAWDALTVKNANLPGGRKVFTGAKATTLDAGDLFPFADGVGAYAGNCVANDPAGYAGQTNYFQPGAPRGYTTLDPGQALAPVDVEMPALRVNVTRQATGSPATVPTWTRTQVQVTSLDSGCSSTFQVQPTDRTASNATVSFDFAMPFGKYRVCAYTRGRTSATNSTVIDRRYTTTASAGSSPTNPADQNLTNAPATADRAITMTTPSAGTTASTGTCF